jgi:hypothetical protein
LRRLARLPDVDRAPALRHLVGKPGLETETGHLLEGVDGLVLEVAPQFRDRRLRLGEVPEDEADEQG